MTDSSPEPSPVRSPGFPAYEFPEFSPGYGREEEQEEREGERLMRRIREVQLIEAREQLQDPFVVEVRLYKGGGLARRYRDGTWQQASVRGGAWPEWVPWPRSQRRGFE
jgi:hypothetical protein